MYIIHHNINWNIIIRLISLNIRCITYSISVFSSTHNMITFTYLKNNYNYYCHFILFFKNLSWFKITTAFIKSNTPIIIPLNENDKDIISNQSKVINYLDNNNYYLLNNYYDYHYY